MKNYDAWEISQEDFPSSGTIEEKILFCARYGILAPSTHNIQPWKFVIQKNTLKIFPDLQRYSLPESDATKRNLFMTLGACTTNVVVAAAYFGFSVTVSYHGNSPKTFFILVTFATSKKRDTSLIALFPFITQRYSNKRIYESRTLDKRIVAELSSLQIGTVLTHLIAEKEIIEQIGSIHQKAFFALLSRKGLRQELARWLRPNDTAKSDGMPGFVMGAPLFLSKVMPHIFPYGSFMVKKLAVKDASLITTSPVVGVIASEKSDKNAWVHGGRLYELIALTAAKNGVSLAPMTAMVEDSVSHTTLRKICGIEEKYLQLFFRLGYSRSKPYHTPRIDIESLIMK